MNKNETRLRIRSLLSEGTSLAKADIVAGQDDSWMDELRQLARQDVSSAYDETGDGSGERFISDSATTAVGDLSYTVDVAEYLLELGEEEAADWIAEFQASILPISFSVEGYEFAVVPNNLYQVGEKTYVEFSVESN